MGCFEMTFLFASLAFYTASLISAICFLIKRRFSLFSNYSLFFFLSTLYVVSPAVNHLFPTFLSEWAPVYGAGVIERYIVLSALCNFVFLWVYCRNARRPGHKKVFLEAPGYAISRSAFISVLLLGSSVIFLGAKYPYGQSRPEMIHSLISNLSVLTSGASILCLFILRDWKIAAVFGVVTLCMLVECSRWAFISALIALLFYLDDQERLPLRVKIASILVASLLLSSVALYRLGGGQPDLLAAPFFVEGVMGSYPAVQSVVLISKGFSSFSYFSDYIVDPIVYLVPRFIFRLLDLQKDAIGLFPSLIAHAQGLLPLPFAPRGGFHYIAQANLAVPYAGPLIVTALLAWITAYIENRRTISVYMFIFYYLFSAGFFFVFIKTIFALTVKYFITLSIPTAFFVFLMFKQRGLQLRRERPDAFPMI